MSKQALLRARTPELFVHDVRRRTRPTLERSTIRWFCCHSQHDRFPFAGLIRSTTNDGESEALLQTTFGSPLKCIPAPRGNVLEAAFEIVRDFEFLIVSKIIIYSSLRDLRAASWCPISGGFQAHYRDVVSD